MGEGSAFHYARIAAQAEDRLLSLFDVEAAIEQSDQSQNAPAEKEEDCSCAG